MEQWSDFIWVAVGVLWVLIQLFRRRGDRRPAAGPAARQSAKAAKPPATTGGDPTPVPRTGEAPPPIVPR